MFKKNQIDSNLDTAIDSLLEFLSKADVTSPEYAASVTHLAKLYDIRKTDRISKDTWITVATHLGGIIAVLQHERAHVIASKAFGFVKKIV